MKPTVIISDSTFSTVSGGSPSQAVPHLLTQQNEIPVNNIVAAGQVMSDLPEEEYTVGFGHDLFPAVAFCHGFFGLECTLILLGANDYQQDIPLLHFGTNYRQLVQPCMALKPVVVVSPLHMRDLEGVNNALGLTPAKYREEAASIASEYGAGYIDGLSLVPDDPAYFEPTGLHMNAAGHQLCKDNLVTAMQGLGYWGV